MQQVQQQTYTHSSDTHMRSYSPNNGDMTLKDFQDYFNVFPSRVEKMDMEKSINFGKIFNCTKEMSWKEEDCSETFLCFVETIKSLSCEMDCVGEIQIQMKRFFTPTEIISGKTSVMMESFVWVLAKETLAYYPPSVDGKITSKDEEHVIIFLISLLNGIVTPPCPSLLLLAYNAASKEKKNANVMDIVRDKIMFSISKGLVKEHRQVLTLETLMKMEHIDGNYHINPNHDDTSNIFLFHSSPIMRTMMQSSSIRLHANFI
jgi:hypothetical protein